MSIVFGTTMVLTELLPMLIISRNIIVKMKGNKPKPKKSKTEQPKPGTEILINNQDQQLLVNHPNHLAID